MALVLDCLLLALGTTALAWLARYCRLPPLLGMIVAGMVFGALDLTASLQGPGLESISTPVRLGALTVVLLRAGLGLSIEDLRAAGGLGLRLATIPMLGDAALVTAGGVLILGLPVSHALVLGFLVAAISPAIVIPGLLDLLRKPAPESRRVLNALLVGAPLDNIFAVVLMGVALDAAIIGITFTTSARLVFVLAWKVLLGLAVGVAVGSVLGGVLRRLGEHGGGWGGLATLLVVAGGVVTAGNYWDFSYVLALLSLGAALRRAAPDTWKRVDEKLLVVWGVVQYALFGLIGAAVDLESAASAGLAVAVIALGQVGRAAGSFAATAASGLDLRSRTACVLAYVPKATIQAAFAALALERGLDSGGLILTAGVLAVVLTAPAGVLTLYHGTAKLLGSDLSS